MKKRISRIVARFYRYPSFSYHKNKLDLRRECGTYKVYARNAEATVGYNTKCAEIITLTYRLTIYIKSYKKECIEAAIRDVIERTRVFAKMLELDIEEFNIKKINSRRKLMDSIAIIYVKLSRRNTSGLVTEDLLPYLDRLYYTNVCREDVEDIDIAMYNALVEYGYAEPILVGDKLCYKITSRGRRVRALINKTKKVFKTTRLFRALASWKRLQGFLAK